MRNYTYNLVNCDKFPISLGIGPDILLEYKDLNKSTKLKKEWYF